MKRNLIIWICILYWLIGCGKPIGAKIDSSVNSDTTSIADSGIKIKQGIDTSNCGLVFHPFGTYIKAKSEVLNVRDSLAKLYFESTDSVLKDSLLVMAGHLFENNIISKIIPFWYGTPWDFEGYTNVPNKGVVACGYFVSTTLKHMGLNLNRYALAQKGPLQEAFFVAIDSAMFRRYEYEETSKMPIFLESLSTGLYFIGLESHVGYLYKNVSGIYFIHSNYYDGYVMAEKVQESKAFISYSFYVSRISSNKFLMKYWLENLELTNN